MDEIPGLHSFLGRNRRIDILDLLLPLGEVPFQLGHLLVARPDLSRDQCVRILDTLVAEGLIKASFPGAKPEGRWYSLCTDQKRIWAMNNLVHSIFEDGRRRASMRAMGMKIPCPGEKS